MLRVLQQAQSRLQAVVSCSQLSVRSASTALSWPSDVPVPEGARQYDPDGPLSQIDALAANQHPDDPHVKIIMQMRDLKVALDKLEMESSSVRLITPARARNGLPAQRTLVQWRLYFACAYRAAAWRTRTLQGLGARQSAS